MHRLNRTSSDNNYIALLVKRVIGSFTLICLAYTVAVLFLMNIVTLKRCYYCVSCLDDIFSAGVIAGLVVGVVVVIIIIIVVVVVVVVVVIPRRRRRSHLSRSHTILPSYLTFSCWVKLNDNSRGGDLVQVLGGTGSAR